MTGLPTAFLAAVLSLHAAGSATQPAFANRPDRALLARWERTVQGQHAVVTAAYYDELTSQVTVLHPEVRLLTASIVKVAIAAATLRADHDRPDIPTRALLTAMITRSDNVAADSLWNALGRARGLQQFLRAADLRQTTPGPGTEWGLTTTSALDQVNLLHQIRHGDLLTPHASRYLLTLMANVIPSQRWGISSGLPPGTALSIKDGWLLHADGWHVNSIGVVGGSHPHDLAILTGRGPSYEEGIGLAIKLALTLQTPAASESPPHI